MGKPIVYCGTCGRSLREEDFASGKAHLFDHQPFCSACRTAPRGMPADTPRRGTSPSQKTSTSRIPTVSTSTRLPHARRKEAWPLVLGGALAGLALLLAVSVVAVPGRSDRPAPTPSSPARPTATLPAAPAAPSPASAKPRPRPEVEQTPAQIAVELEAFAAAEKNPDAILLRCEQAQRFLVATPQEEVLRKIRARAEAARSEFQKESKVAAALDSVREIEKSDPEYLRGEEVLNLLEAARGLGGSNRAKVEAELTAYSKRLQDFRKAAEAERAAPTAQPGATALRIESIWLVRAPGGEPVKGFDPIPDGAVLTLTAETGRDFALVARIPAGMQPGAVRFSLRPGKTTVEGSPPFAYPGDDGGVFRPWTPASGKYQIAARPFTGPGASGASGPSITLSFTVVGP